MLQSWVNLIIAITVSITLRGHLIKNDGERKSGCFIHSKMILLFFADLTRIPAIYRLRE